MSELSLRKMGKSSGAYCNTKQPYTEVWGAGAAEYYDKYAGSSITYYTKEVVASNGNSIGVDLSTEQTFNFVNESTNASVLVGKYLNISGIAYKITSAYYSSADYCFKVSAYNGKVQVTGTKIFEVSDQQKYSSAIYAADGYCYIPIT